VADLFHGFGVEVRDAPFRSVDFAVFLLAQLHAPGFADRQFGVFLPAQFQGVGVLGELLPTHRQQERRDSTARGEEPQSILQRVDLEQRRDQR
jgi:hypothetical protein